MSQARFTLRLPHDIGNKLAVLSKVSGRSRNDIIKELLSKALDNVWNRVSYYVQFRREKERKLVIYVVTCQSGKGPVKIVTSGVLKNAPDAELIKTIRIKHSLSNLSLLPPLNAPEFIHNSDISKPVKVSLDGGRKMEIFIIEETSKGTAEKLLSPEVGNSLTKGIFYEDAKGNKFEVEEIIVNSVSKKIKVKSVDRITSTWEKDRRAAGWKLKNKGE